MCGPIAVSIPGWGRFAEDVVWAKLASLCDGTRLASERPVSERLSAFGAGRQFKVKDRALVDLG
jgi:hypothetical protein